MPYISDKIYFFSSLSNDVSKNVHYYIRENKLVDSHNIFPHGITMYNIRKTHNLHVYRLKIFRHTFSFLLF